MAILSLLTKPQDAILAEKLERDFGRTMLMLFSVSLMIAISVMVYSAVQQSARISDYYYYGGNSGINVTSVLMGGVIAFVLSVVVMLFEAFLIKVAVTTLGGRGGFKEGLTVEVFTIFAPATAFLIISILMAGLQVPILAIVLAVLMSAVLIYALVLGYATFYRSIKEFFETDMLTAFVASSIFSLIGAAVFFMFFGVFSSLMYYGFY